MKPTQTTICTAQDTSQLNSLIHLLIHQHGPLEPEEIQHLLQEEFGAYYSLQDIVLHNNVSVEEEDCRVNLGNCGINY